MKLAGKRFRTTFCVLGIEGQFKGSNEQESKKRHAGLYAAIRLQTAKLCCAFLDGVKHTPRDYFA
jgi:hypothetical protein